MPTCTILATYRTFYPPETAASAWRRYAAEPRGQGQGRLAERHAVQRGGRRIDPQSPYARTKAVCEAMFADIAAAQPLRMLSLWYFNPIGADPKMRTGLQLRRPVRP